MSLLHRADAELIEQIVVFEPLPEIGPGEPYGPDLATNLLNIPAGRMSAFAENRGHFLEWVRAQGDRLLAKYGVKHLDAETFLPRPMFGEYLQFVWGSLLEQAAAMGIQVKCVHERVTRIEREAVSGVAILHTATDAVSAHNLVLCNGNLASTAYAELQGLPGYFHSPYPVSALVTRIPEEAAVLVIGSSLSAVDAIVGLREAGHAGQITAVSRNGRLPSVRSVVVPDQPITSPTVEELAACVHDPAVGLTLEDLFGLLSERVLAAGGALDVKEFLGLNAELRVSLDHEIRAASEDSRVWQGVAISLNEVVEHAWNMMPDAERQRLYKIWRPIWMNRRATFPLVNAIKIRRYLEAANFDILEAGEGLQITAAAGGGFDVRIQARGNHESALAVDYVVNATGMSTDVTRATDGLVVALLESGMAVPDPYGGLRLDFDTGCLIDAQGTVQQDISALGSLATGTYFWTMSLDVNARLALEQARRLVTSLIPAGQTAV